MGVLAHALTIANGQTTSGALNIEGRCVVGISVGTVAATTATFTATHEGAVSPKGVGSAGTFRAVRDSAGAALSFATPDDSHIVIDPASLASMQQIKIVAGTAASGDETWTVITRTVT